MTSKIGTLKCSIIMVSAVTTFMLLSVILLSAIVFVSSWLRKENHEAKGRIGKYRYFQFDSTKNDAVVGVVSIPENLSPDHFFSYEDEFGKTNVISRVGSTEYYCTGVCSCDDDKERRRSAATILGKGLTYIAAAISSVIAYNLAKEYFDGECRSIFVDGCDPSKVRSELIECVRDIKKREETGFHALSRYWCSGHCLETNLVLGPRKRRELQERHMYGDNCEDISGESPVLIPHNVQTRKMGAMELARIYFVRGSHNKYMENESVECVRMGESWKDRIIFDQ